MATAPTRTLVPLLTAALALALASCGPPSPADVLQLTDLNPRQLEVGDRVEVSAQNLPAAADIARISVTLRGVLARPGRASCNGPVEVTVSDPPVGATVTSLATGQSRAATYAESTERVIRLEGASGLSFAMSDELLAKLTRCPGERARGVDVPHATLALGGGAGRGAGLGVTVRIEGLTGSRAVAGSLRGPVLDLSAPAAARVGMESAARHDAERALDFLGIALAASHPVEGGLRVAGVRQGSPAERAGVGANDVLARIDGATVLSLADFRPAAGASSTTISVLRNDVLDERVVSLDGFVPRAPTDLVAAAVVLAVLALALGLALAPRPDALAYLEARVAAALRDRRRSPVPFHRWVRESVRAAFAPGARGRGEALERTALVLALCAVATTALAVPLGGTFFASDADVGGVYAVAAFLRLAAFLLGGAPSRSGRGSLARRGIAFLLCRLPAVLALASVVLAAGSLGVRSIVAAQGGLPWEWYAFRTPASLALFALFAAPVLGTTAEPARGARSRTAALGAASEWAGVFVVSALGAALFLGGWQLPGVALAEQEASAALQMLGALVLMAKAWGFVFAALAVRRALPSLRLEALLAACGRSVAGLTALSCAASVGWLWALTRLPSAAEGAMAQSTFALCVLLVAWAAARRVVKRAQPPAVVPRVFG